MTPIDESPRTRRYPLYVLTGGWGSGKTSLLNALLGLRPAHERWAILLNEVGRTQVNVNPTANSAVTVRDAAGACACCTGQVVFVTALGTLIRQTRPHRVFVEASSQASLESLLQSIRTSFKDSVNVERVVALPDPTRPVTTGERDKPVFVSLDGWPDHSLLRSILDD